MSNLRNQVFEIMENLLSCGSLEFPEDRVPSEITKSIFENNLVPSNTSKNIVEELVKIWFEENKDLDFENLPN